MKGNEIQDRIKKIWAEFRYEKLGIAGLVLLVVFILIICFEPLIVPFPAATTHWRDIKYWENNPRAVPPVWVDLFPGAKHVKTVILKDMKASLETGESMKTKSIAVPYRFHGDIPPEDILLTCTVSGSPMIILTITRPDNLSLELVRKPIEPGNTKRSLRISTDNDGRDSVFYFGYSYDRSVDSSLKNMIHPTELLFAEAGQGMFSSPRPLKGDYRVRAEILLLTDSDDVEDLTFVFPGSVSGLLGTDNSKRDIFSGLISGFKWAFLIGLLTAVIAVSFGVIYGVMSAYLGGWKDSLMQRIFEVFLSIPLLPLLIVMSAVFKPSIFTLIFMMSCFFWTGPVKTVRSIGLQIKEEVYIEASQSIGASDFRIIFFHMIPLLIPYAFASMALYVPGAIVYESTISLLGLGDATIVTWGQILHDALEGGAVINAQWWWVIPPGLAIATMSMAFAFIGFAMDKLLHPKLRTR
ncbi:MAG: ABC transporter permease [Spirochaetales bacterium]|nr:ABC transporter permease [Spirochaetales bacterium]